MSTNKFFEASLKKWPKLMMVNIAVIAMVLAMPTQGYQSKPVEKRSALQANGTKISSAIKVNDLDGNEKLINYPNTGKLMVLYIFATSCVWCARNLENIKTVANNSRKGYQVIGIALNDENLKDYVSNKQLNFPIYKKPSMEAVNELKLGNTPQTIVMSSQGKVLKNWLGVYNNITRKEIEKFFSVKLPNESIAESADLPQVCIYCLRNSLIYSPGSVVKLNSQRIRCKQDGRWTAPY